METGIIGTGIISSKSKHWATILASVNGIQRSLPFNKTMLYMFGSLCDGDMTNILQEGMEVNFSYTLSERLKTPLVTAVWIGDKPVVSILHEPWEAVYGLNGRVNQVLDDGNFLVVCKKVYRGVLINKEVTYKDGELTRIHVSVDDNIMFDATPVKAEHSSGAMYVATCAWIGKEPRLVDRFKLNNSNPAKPTERLKVVYGTVEVILNDAVAFVKVEEIDDKIMLFRSSFNSGVERLGDVTEVGDRLCMNLHFGFVSPGYKQWYVAKACNSGAGINDVDCINPEETQTGRNNPEETQTGRNNPEETQTGRNNPEETQTGRNNPEETQTGKNNPEETQTGRNNPEETQTGRNNPEETQTGRNNPEVIQTVKIEKTEVMEVVEESTTCSPTLIKPQPVTLIKDDCFKLSEDKLRFNAKSEVLFSDPPLRGLTYHVACKRRHLTLVNYGKLTIHIGLGNFYIDGFSCLHETRFQSSEVRSARVNFEAVLARLSDHKQKKLKGIKFTHDATCAWIGPKPTIDVVALTIGIPPAGIQLAKKNVIYRGKVARLLLPDKAVVILALERQTVCLHLSSFDSKIFPGRLITDIVKLRQWVQFRLVQNDDCPFPVCASDAEIIDKRYLTKYGDEGDNTDCSEEFKMDEDDAEPRVLFKFPALTGCVQASPEQVHKRQPSHAIIFCDFGQVHVDARKLFIHGRRCTIDEFNSLVESGKNVLNYEAILQSENRYQATCAWIGQKPSLTDVVSHLPSDRSITQLGNLVFVGRVGSFYLPEVAVIYISGSIVCLHLRAFGARRKSFAEYSDSGEGLITDFVELNECVEFRVRLNPNCPLGVCAYDARKSTKRDYRKFSKYCKKKSILNPFQRRGSFSTQ